MNNKQLIEQWVKGNVFTNKRVNTLTATHYEILTYSKTLATRFDDGRVIVTGKKYSVTSSKHTGKVKAACALNNIPFTISETF